MRPSTAHIFYLFAAIVLVTSNARPMRHGSLPLPVNLLPQLRSSGGRTGDGLTCESWRFASETNNIRDWSTVPSSCEEYVADYMLGDGFQEDSIAVTSAAIAYVESLELKGDGKEIFIFDADETTISNLPYYAEHGFGSEVLDGKLFGEWVEKGSLPPLRETLKLYNKVLSLGIKPVILSGRPEQLKNITIQNLKSAGYHSWERFIIKGSSLTSSSAAFKAPQRQNLVDEGYKIVGNIGDQWSDILGSPEGDRIFKLPNPMYYVS